MNIVHGNIGWLEVIGGPMFLGQERGVDPPPKTKRRSAPKHPKKEQENWLEQF
jgi:hypothetical protein